MCVSCDSKEQPRAERSAIINRAQMVKAGINQQLADQAYNQRMTQILQNRIQERQVHNLQQKRYR